MYRGRPSPRGGYPQSFDGRGPLPPREYPAPAYRDDRSRPRPSYHPDYHDHVHPDPFRRSPPRRRYPSPGSGSQRGGEYWTGGPPRERSLSPRGSIPLDHKLVITVGNELTGPSGSAPSRHHDRDYPPRPDYERSRSQDRSPDRSRAKSRGRSKSRPRSHSRSPDRKRAKSRPRSRSPDRSRAKSRGRSRSRSPDRSRAKSRGRSKSRSPDRSRAKSRGRSKSRPRSRSRSRSSGRSRGRSYSRAASRGRSKSLRRSRSASSSSSSSSRDDDNDGEKSRKEFKELETARRRKELEEILNLPTKSILKRRNESEDSPSLRSSDSPRALEASNMSRVADQLLLAVKGMEPHKVASMLSELQSDPHMAQRAGLNAEIKEILSLLGGQAAGPKVQQKTADDIDDEEEFLYGDSEEPKPPPASEPFRHHGLDLYADVTEELLYGDYPPQKAAIPPTYGLLPGASPHLQAPPTMGEVDMRYGSRPTVDPDQDLKVHVSNPAYPPGTEPLEGEERQAVEEYEKIQDLLKTIGLDLGVSEISKMAARTKERLQGNKTPTRRRRYSSDSSDGSRGCRRRSHSGGSSSSSSRSRSRGRGGNWSSEEDRRNSSGPQKSFKDQHLKETEQSDAGPKTQDPLPPHPGMPIPTYPPPQVHSMMPPNFPPPGYGQYGNYLPYMHQQWPPMYPPPNMSLPPPTIPDETPPTLPYTDPCNKPAPEPGPKGSGQSVQDGEKGKVSSRDRRVAEEQNNESQKQKVLEEREKLKQERDVRMKKKEYLMKELERLRKQQGELLRKKRREKGGHKDPLLQEISHLQEEVMTQISNLRKEHEAAEKKRSEIEKVALILGLSPSDRPRRTGKPPEHGDDAPPSEKDKGEPEKSPEGRRTASSSGIKTSAGPPPHVCALAPPPEPFEYYDAGNHWCKNCNVTSGSMFDFFTHLHSKTHRKTLDPYHRPWASTPNKSLKSTTSEEKLTKPAKGSEFLLPVRGFFCLLCRGFFGDAICAEEHVTTHAHNEKYKKQMYENPLYEQRRNLDRQAGLTSETSGKKRKHEDEVKGGKDKEDKSKHKKEKKKEESDTGQKEEKFKKEEEVLKPSKKEENFKDAKSLEEERPPYSKKDEDEKYKYSKKDDKYRYSREEEERAKHRDEDDRYKYSREEECRYRYQDYRYDDQPKYGQREDEDKYKYSKYSDFRSKNVRERDEGKLQTEKEACRKSEPGKPAGKPEVVKAGPPPKPYDPPKIFCGPSPAMRAKLRKQSLEVGKTAPAAANPSFGKFTWKKKENILAKEAQKVAAEFTKEDEAAAKQSPEDSFAKSMAVAKEIAQKLGDQPNMPPPWVSNASNRGRIRPNLPAPAAFHRKTAMLAKPAPLNTFLSIRPQNTGLLGPPPKHVPIFPDPAPLNTFPSIRAQNPSLVGPPPKDVSGFPGSKSNPLNAHLQAQPKPPNGKPGPSMPPPADSRPKLVEAGPAAQVSKPPPVQTKPVVSVAKPAPSMAEPAPSMAKPAPSMAKPAPSQAEPAPSMAEPAPSMAETAPSMAKPAPSQAKPAPSQAEPAQPAMIKIVSDVAAPGVPESEQTRTVFVKPPPFMAMGDGTPRFEKLKSNLAAAKAQDLFGIFYSSKSSTSSITKPAADKRANSTNKSQPPLQAQKPQPQHRPPTQSQPPAVVCTSPQPESNNSPCPQTHSEADIQIASVWSLQSSPVPEEDPPRITSQTTQPRPKTQTESHNQSRTPKSEHQITPEIMPTELEPTLQTQSRPKLNPQNQTEPQTEPQLDKGQSPAQSESQSVSQNQSSSCKSDSFITHHTKPAQLDPTPQTLFQSGLTPESQTEQHSKTPPDQDGRPPHHPDTVPEPEHEPKPSPKTRVKTRTPPAARPVRQTRYQTRRQQQSQSEPEPSGEPESAASDSKGPDTSEEGAPNEGSPEMMEITPETLGLPSDMTSLNFDTDFNFE